MPLRAQTSIQCSNTNVYMKSICYIFIMSGEKASEAVHAGAGDSRVTERQGGKKRIHQGATEGWPHYALCMATVSFRIGQDNSFSSLHCPVPAKTA